MGTHVTFRFDHNELVQLDRLVEWIRLARERDGEGWRRTTRTDAVKIAVATMVGEFKKHEAARQERASKRRSRKKS